MIELFLFPASWPLTHWTTSASEELSGQAQTLKQIVGAFKLKNVETSASKALGYTPQEEYVPAVSFDLYDDKYWLKNSTLSGVLFLVKK